MSTQPHDCQPSLWDVILTSINGADIPKACKKELERHCNSNRPLKKTVQRFDRLRRKPPRRVAAFLDTLLDFVREDTLPWKAFAIIVDILFAQSLVTEKQYKEYSWQAAKTLDR